MRLSALLTVVLTVAATFGAWSLFTRTYDAPPIEGLLHGVTYAPYAKDQDAARGDKPRVEQMERDMRTLAGRVRYIRTYTALDGIDQVARIADQYGIRVIAGAWVDHRVENSQRDVAALIRMTNDNGNVERVLVGNETILRWDGNPAKNTDLSPAQLIRYILQVKRNVKVPVSTARASSGYFSQMCHGSAVETGTFTLRFTCLM